MERTISLLPRDLDYKIVLELPYKDIIRLSNISRKYRKIYNDPYFWKAKLDKDFISVDMRNLRGTDYLNLYRFYHYLNIYETIEKRTGIFEHSYVFKYEPGLSEKEMQKIDRINRHLRKVSNMIVKILSLISPDERTLKTTELRFSISSFYLSRRMRYPVREGQLIIIEPRGIVTTDKISLYIFRANNQLKIQGKYYTGYFEDLPEALLKKHNYEEIFEIYGLPRKLK